MKKSQKISRKSITISSSVVVKKVGIINGRNEMNVRKIYICKDFKQFRGRCFIVMTMFSKLNLLVISRHWH